MTDELTLGQVKQAGRFAWHTQGYLWIPSEPGLSGIDSDRLWLPLFTPTFELEEERLFSLNVNVESMFGDLDFDEWADDELGWHHLPSCDCEFCRA